MRRSLRYSGVAGIVLLVLASSGWALRDKLLQHHARQQRLAQLAPFTARHLNGTTCTPLLVATGPLVILYFEPDCEHCQRQAAEINRHMVGFGEVHLLWLSKDSLPELQHFAQQYGLLRQPATQVMQIRLKLAKKMDFLSVPDIRVYDPTHKLVRRFRGETSAAAISQAIAR